MANTKVTKILMRNGTTTEWELAPDPKLEQGEIGVEVDTYRMKIGTDDNAEAWDSIGYFAGGITSVEGVHNNDQLTNGLDLDEDGVLRMNIDELLDSVEANNKAVERLDSIAIRIDSIELRLDTIELRLDTIEPKLDTVESIAKGALTLSQSLVKDIIHIESSISGIDGRLDIVEDGVAIHWDSIHMFEDTIDELFDSVDGANILITYLMDDKTRQDILLQELRGNVDSLAGAVDTVGTEVEDILDRLRIFILVVNENV